MGEAQPNVFQNVPRGLVRPLGRMGSGKLPPHPGGMLDYLEQHQVPPALTIEDPTEFTNGNSAPGQPAECTRTPASAKAMPG